MARSCPWLRSPVRPLLNIWLRNSTKLNNILGEYQLAVSALQFKASFLSLLMDGSSAACYGSPSFTFNVTIMKTKCAMSFYSSRQPWKSLRHAPFCPLLRENLLVLDIFFEALNYEKIEQKKAYEIAGLLGKYSSSLPFMVLPSFEVSSLSCGAQNSESDDLAAAHLS